MQPLEGRRLLAAGISEYPLRTIGGTPIAATTAADGNVWFTTANTVGKLVVSTGAVTQYPIPTYNSGAGAIARGPDGNLWFVESTANAIARLIPATGAITEYPLLTTAGAGLNSIVGGSTADGHVYFTEGTGNRVGRIDPSTGVIQEYVAPSGAQPHGLTLGTDGAIWYTMNGTNQVGRLDPSTGMTTAYTVVTGTNGGLTGITCSSAGVLYYSESSANAIGSFNIATASVGTTYSTGLTASAGLGTLAIDGSGHLFAVEQAVSKVAMLTISTASITEKALSGLGLQTPTGLAVGGDGGLYVMAAVSGGGLGGATSPTIGKYTVPALAGSKITFAATTGQNPSGAAIGADGALWYLVPADNAIGRYDPATHLSVEYPLTLKASMGAVMAVGPGGDLFFGETGAYVGQFRPSTGALVQEYPTNSSNPGIAGIAYNSVDGGIWFTESTANKIGRLNPSTGAVVETAVPTSAAGLGSIAVTAGAGLAYDGYVWFGESAQKMGRINVSTNPYTVTEYAVGVAPNALAYNPVDKRIWFTTGYYNIGSIDPLSPATAPRLLTIPTHYNFFQCVSVAIAIGGDGQVWATEGSYNINGVLYYEAPYVEDIDPTTGVFKEFATTSGPISLATATDGNVWYSGSGTPGVVGLVTRSAFSMPTSIAYSLSPSNQTKNKGFGLIVAVKNAAGHVDTDYTGAVSLTLSGGTPGATLVGTTTVNASNGLAIFPGLTIDTAGDGYTITATTVTGQAATGQDTYSVTSAAFSVANPATHVAVVAPAGPVVAGTAFTATVRAVDDVGRVDPSYAGQATLSIGNNPAGATLVGTRIVDLTYGIATFSGLSIATAGNGYTLTATAPNLVAGASAAFNVVAGAASKLALTMSDSTITAGGSTSVTVRVVDSYGNTATTFAGVVAISVDDPLVTAPSAYTFTAADQGVHTFIVPLNTAGTRTISATGSGNQLGTTAVVVTPAAPASLALVVPGSATSGVSFVVTVRAVDAFGNVATNYAGTVHVTTSDSSGTTPADYTFSAVDQGVHTLSLTIRATGNSSFTVSDSSNGFQASGSVAVSVNATTTNVATNVASPVYGQSWTVHANVAAAVAGGDPLVGSVQFAVDGADLGSPVALSGGVATSPAIVGLDAGSHAITARYLGDAESAASASTTLNVTIRKATLNVAATNASKVYGQSNPSLAATLSGFVLGQDVSVLGGALAVTTNAQDGSPVGSYSIQANGLASGNYAFNYAGGTLSITPAPLTITALDASTTYGISASPTASYSGFVLGQGPSSLVGSLAFAGLPGSGASVGSYPITPTGLSSTNYTITYVPATVVITPTALTIKAIDATTTYGTLAGPTVSYSGFVLGQGPSSLVGSLAFAGLPGSGSSVGSYPITPTGLSSTNYTITYVPATVAITPAMLTITPVDAVKPIGAALPAFSVRYDGFVNGDSASVLASAPVVTTDAVASSLSGTYALHVSGASASNYTIAYGTGALTVLAPVGPVSTATTLKKGAVTGLTIDFGGAIGAGAKYRLVTAGADRRFGTKDDKALKIKSVTYNAALHRIVLALKSPLARTTSAQLRVTGLIDSNGVAVDGNRDGKVGGDLVINLAKGRATFGNR